MKKLSVNAVISIVAVCIFALVIALVWVLGLAGIDSEPDPETGEIRQLASFPEEYSNDYFAKINTYFNDHSPMRNSIISALNKAERSMSDIYNEKVLDPIYEAIAKANATPEPDTSLAPDQTVEPTPTPDFSGLFGDETEEPENTPSDSFTPAPTAAPTPTSTPEPTPTPGPTDTPEPAATPFTGEHAELVACTLDTIVLDDIANFGYGDGSALSKLGNVGGVVDNSNSQYKTLLMRGWVGFSKEIQSFGYKIGKADPVFSEEFFTPHESAVEAAGGGYARRFNLSFSLDGIKGENLVCLVVRFVTGEVLLMDGSNGNISFPLLGEEEPDKPLVFNSSIEVPKDRDVMIDASRHTLLKLQKQAVSKIAAEKAADKYVQFLFRDAWFAFDTEAFTGLINAAGSGRDITFEAKEAITSDLTEEQRNALSDKIVCAVLTVDLKAGTRTFTAIGGAKIVVNLKYQKPSDVDLGNIRVAALSDDGVITRVSAVYSEGVFTFKTDISSKYVIYIDYNTEEETADPGVTPEPTPSGSETCDHRYGAAVQKSAPTCTRSGRSEQVCSICGHVKSTDIPALGHDYALIREQEATYAHDGYVLERCTRCGNGKVSNIVLRTSLPGFYNSRRPITYEGAGFKGIHDWYFYAGDNSLGYFQGENVLSEAECEDWTAVYEEFHSICESKGINVVYLIAPNKEQVYGEYMPSGVTVVDDSLKREPGYVQYLKSVNSPIHYVYPLAQLKSAKILYETYLQQDTHWNTVGGFIGAMQVYQSIGLPVTGLQSVDVELTDAASGDLVSLGVGPAKHYTGYSINYKPEITVTQTYMYSNNVVGGNGDPNGELRILESDAPTTAKAVIIGDSFRHAIAPFIAKDFCKVTVTHRGDFNTVSNTVLGPDGEIRSSGKMVMRDALRDLKSGDMLLVMAVERYDGGNVDMVRALIDYFKIMG